MHSVSTFHGQSVSTNAGPSDVDEWLDNGRDIINFLTYYLPDTIGYSGDELPTHLPLIPQEISGAREKAGLANRTLVAIGHSFGGCTM